MIQKGLTNDLIKVEDLSGKSTKEMYDYFIKKKSDESFMKMMRREMRDAKNTKNSKNQNWKQGSLFP